MKSGAESGRVFAWLWAGGVFLIAVVLTAAFFPWEAALAEPAQLSILHTNNVTGHLFGCPT